MSYGKHGCYTCVYKGIAGGLIVTCLRTFCVDKLPGPRVLARWQTSHSAQRACLRVSNPICRRKHHSTAGRNQSSAENVPGNKGSEMGSVQPEERSPGAMRTAKRR
ncbi:predicted protein [Coccidioides posadasii str. Silveira]|uniref:Predicted protein n=1 Tax=Coccidioides posadasii (strain RMSCC 757 / Silveira) TaxID=443226 RepID=E9CW28_COCPS|nr:predicted protein [Coccidioides posadasii str. Silveira]